MRRWFLLFVLTLGVLLVTPTLGHALVGAVFGVLYVAAWLVLLRPDVRAWIVCEIEDALARRRRTIEQARALRRFEHFEPLAVAPSPAEPGPPARREDQTPIARAPFDPAPADLVPSDLAPSDLAPSDPASLDLVRSDLAPSNPAPADLAPSNLAPSNPAPFDPAPADLTRSNPAPLDLAPLDLAPFDPALSDLVPSDLVSSDLAPCDLAPSDPIAALVAPPIPPEPTPGRAPTVHVEGARAVYSPCPCVHIDIDLATFDPHTALAIAADAARSEVIASDVRRLRAASRRGRRVRVDFGGTGPRIRFEHSPSASDPSAQPA